MTEHLCEELSFQSTPPRGKRQGSAKRALEVAIEFQSTPARGKRQA